MSKGEKGKAGAWGKETAWREGNHLLRLNCGMSRSREEGLRKRAVLSEGMYCGGTRARQGVGARQSPVIFSWAQLRPSSCFLQALGTGTSTWCPPHPGCPHPTAPMKNPHEKGEGQELLLCIF